MGAEFLSSGPQKVANQLMDGSVRGWRQVFRNLCLPGAYKVVEERAKFG